MDDNQGGARGLVPVPCQCVSGSLIPPMTVAFDHLVAIAENAVPEGAEVCTLTTADALELRLAFWRGTGMGTVLVLPGRSEFIEKYFEVVGDLRARGFSVAVLDWRGQGGSQRELADPRKGHVDDFHLYLRDLDAALTFMAAQDLPRPWYGLAHSMGGAVLALAVAGGERRLLRAVLSAPMFGIHGISSHGASSLLAGLLSLAGLGGRYVPGGRTRAPSAFSAFEGNVLTSDPVRYRRAEAVLIAGPDLAIGAPTVAWATAAFRAIRELERPESGLASRCPLLIVAASADTVVSTPASERLAQRWRGAACVTIPGARHEILMERDGLRTQFWAAFDAFIGDARAAEASPPST